MSSSRQWIIPRGYAIPGGCLLILVIAYCSFSLFIIAAEGGFFKTDILEADIGDGYTVKIWSESGEIHSSVRYEIRFGDRVVVPETGIDYVDFDEHFDIQIAYADNGNLVAIYDSVLWGDPWNDGIFILFDKSAELSWPQDHDIEQWKSKYARLQAENSDLPPYFEDLN